MKTLVALLLFFTPGALLAAPNVLNATTHAGQQISPAIVATLGAGVVDVSIFVDYSPTDSTVASLVADSNNPSGTFKSVATNLTVNHQPYIAMNVSYTGYSIGVDEQQYATLVGLGAIVAQPLAIKSNGTQPNGTPPPLVLSGASSRESTNGGTGWGIEFAIEASSCAVSCLSTSGFSISEDSFTSAALAGFLAALYHQHPTWTWFDIKGALRQTAANWSGGYNHNNFGYGTINWPNANAIGSTASLYLQPPNISFQNFGFYVRATLYPYRQTRRDHEVVYSCTPGYSWPVKNEYSLADVTGGCGSLLYTSNGTDVEPTFTYAPAVTSNVTFIAFTTDGAGAYSRVEEFSPVQVSFLVGSSCLK